MDQGDLKFAIISSAPAASALLESVCDELRTRTKLAVTPIQFRSYDKLVAAIKNGEVHVAWAPPLLAIDLERAGTAKVTLSSRRSGKTDYSSVLFVRRESPIRTLHDLKGKHVAWVAKESSAGHVVPMLKLKSLGLLPEELFKEQSYRRTHEAVVKAVIDGDADVGATFAHLEPGTGRILSAGWSHSGVENDNVRVLTSAGPIPSDVIAFSTSLDAERTEAVRRALVDVGDSLKQLLNVDGFELADAAHFDDLRKLVEGATSEELTTVRAS